MVKSRKPMHVDPFFEMKMKELQKKIMKQEGESISLRELTNRISRDPDFDMIEKKILGGKTLRMDFKIKFDRRKNI